MDFPREIRDQIYHHYLYRPKGIVYHRKTTRTFPFDDHYEGITSLLLTCRQVHYEAFQIFTRYNLIEIRTSYHWHQQRYRDKSMDGILRLFPDAPARRLQRVGISMEQYSYIYQSYRRRLDPGQDTAPPGAAFVQMLRDAYTFKSTFPKIREFCVTFRAYNNFFGEQYGFMAEGEDDEEKIVNCVSVMEMWLGESQVVPPSWFRFWFDEVDWRYPGLREQESIWNRAYARVVRERAKKVVEVEGSGKRWIEETSSEGKKKGKKNCK
jgi:hypothetical protein